MHLVDMPLNTVRGEEVLPAYFTYVALGSGIIVIMLLDNLVVTLFPLIVRVVLPLLQ